MKSFFERLPDMECLRGDTLGNFVISPKNDVFNGCRMQVIIAKKEAPEVAIICKECTLVDGEFSVFISSDDTKNLKGGIYFMHFKLIDGSGNIYRKLVGNLLVRKTAQGGF